MSLNYERSIPSGFYIIKAKKLNQWIKTEPEIKILELTQVQIPNLTPSLVVLAEHEDVCQ